MINSLLFCNGEPPSRQLCRRLARKADVIVAADGGANIARRYGITPNVIIGDLDSISAATRRFFGPSTIKRVSTQYSTDLEKALDYLVTQEVTSVTILGVTGKRVDFTLGNLSVLWNYTSRFRLTVVHDGWMAMPIVKELRVRARKETTVSLIPFGPCAGITLKGLEYPLHNARMRIGEIGVSNVVVRSPFSVKVKKGRMMLIIFDENARPV
jgi:thiamine pyrophosphokinase